MSLPKYLIRPRDYSYFYLDGDVYRHQMNKEHKHAVHGHSYEVLISHCFFPAEESELPAFAEKRELYYDFISWQSRSDGHGGVKGGTWEEFFAYKKRLEKYQKNND